MTRQRTHHSHGLTVFALFVALPVLVGLATPGTFASTPPLFLPAVVYGTGGRTSSVVVADINGDRKPDLIVVNGCGANIICLTEGSVAVLLGNGDGTFQGAVKYASGGWNASSAAIADVNGDGNPDLVVANACIKRTSLCPTKGVVAVLLGNGDGTFRTAVTYSSGGWGANSVAIADVNGDGKPDLLLANGCATSAPPCSTSGAVSVLLGSGDGTFQPAVTYGSGGIGAISVAVADVNADGTPDLVVANCGCYFGSFPNGGTVGVLLGNGDGTFRSAESYSSGPNPWSVAVADVNGDGKADLVVANSCWCGVNGTVAVLLGKGDGSFQSAVTYDSGGNIPFSVAVAEVNGDGKADLVVGNWCHDSGCGGDATAGVLLGVGDGTFESVIILDPGGGSATSVAITDVNGDGKPDLLAAIEGGVGVLLNNTTLVDTTPPVITLSVIPKALWPPNGKMVPVTVSGAITDTGSGVNLNSATYAVKDEYGEVQPAGAIALGPGGNYSFTVLLQASRRGSDLDGRRYTVTIRAQDNAGNRGSKTSAVTVPHDQGD